MAVFSRFSLLLSLMVYPYVVYADTASVASKAARQPHIYVELIAERAPDGEHKARMGILFKPDPDWHIYWKNPGDTGLAPTISWQGDAQFGELNWPFPESIPISHLVNLGYHHETVLWTTYDANPDTKIVTANVDWLVCKEACIPGSASLSIDVSGISDQAHEQAKRLFDQAEAKLPEALGTMAASAKVSDGQLTLELYATKPIFINASSVELFVENLDLVAYGEPVNIKAVKNVLAWQQRLNEFNTDLPELLHAVVVVDQKKAYKVQVPLR